MDDGHRFVPVACTEFDRFGRASLSLLRELARRAALRQLNRGEVRDRSLPSLIRTHFERWASALSVAMAKTGSALIMGAAQLVPPVLPTDGSHLGGGGGSEGWESFPPTGQEAPCSATVAPEGRGVMGGGVGPYGGFMPG